MSDNFANRTSLGHDVFVSYASQDAAVANSIVENLELHGLKCWLAPRDVKPGAQYADAIVRAINEANAVVLVDVKREQSLRGIRRLAMSPICLASRFDDDP
jgi:hypothetical protein